MVIVARNVPSEASLKCPICEKKYKIRTTKKHVKDAHGLSINYTCVFPLAFGGVCKFSCGKRISCFINHQKRSHKLNFDEMADHIYDITTHFVVETVDGFEDIHTPTCIKETKFFSDETMKEARKRYKAKVGASKPATAEDKAEKPEPEVEKNSKIKPESDDDREVIDISGYDDEEEAPANDIPEPSQEEEAPVAGVGVCKFSSGKRIINHQKRSHKLNFEEMADHRSDDDREVIDISDDDDEEEAPANDIPEPSQEEEAPANDVPETEQTNLDDEFWEQFYAKQNFVDDSEDEEGRPEPELRRSGVGKFSRDIDVMIKIVTDEMGEAYASLKDDYSAWKRVINKIILCWHPDKNPNFKRKSEEVTKMIIKERLRLESGQKS
jgi:hypothetical protein